MDADPALSIDLPRHTLRIRLFIYCRTSLPGILSCLDGYMNAALENTEEVVNGKVTNNYGDAFVRGNNSELGCRMHCMHSCPVEFKCLLTP